MAAYQTPVGAGKAGRIASSFLLAAGMIVGLVLTALALWPDFEATQFDRDHAGGEPLTGLHCPWLITPADEAAIRLTLTNPRERPINFLVRANISEGFASLMREEKAQSMVEPGESAEFAWPVNAQDAVYGRMILARVRVLRTNGLPARQKACGVFVINNMPLVRGNQIVAGLLVATLSSLGAGGFLWLRQARPLAGNKRDQARLVGLLVLLLLLTMTISLMGWWRSGVLFVIVMMLVLVVVIERIGLTIK